MNKDRNTPTMEAPDDNNSIDNTKKKNEENFVTQHCIDTKHNFKWNDFSILDR